MAYPETSPVVSWTTEDTKICFRKEGLGETSIKVLCDDNRLDGKCLLVLNDSDYTTEPICKLILKDRKCLYVLCKILQRENQNSLVELGIIDNHSANLYTSQPHYSKIESEYCDSERVSPPISEDVTWITAFVMVIVHDRVPDMKKYPPLPDIFLDNVPHIPWAFDMCEVTGTLMFTMWLIVLLFHKHRFILLRRFFALSGTVFLLRCVTMLITSLSVPGTHLQCHPRNFNTQGTSAFADWAKKLSQAYAIWRGAGMSIQGVRTCGDYMFSGHTVALTMLNFFITEYTPRHIYYLHTLSWMMNMFGIFFILAAHEHYSIDVFIAFYISSRLFLYYHTLSNNQALMQRDSTRTRVWFPLFSYFESSVEGIVPNEYETPSEIASNICSFIKKLINDVQTQLTMIVKSSTATNQVIGSVSRTIVENSKNK
ncbi:hypothetical protein JTB14_010412 [Gonioctena quinquepunctata]|nr:hypothetical protein JTB14_010412 [Gonioctena quinquepunctata]